MQSERGNRNVSDVLNKYRVTVDAGSDGVWLKAQKFYPAQPGLWNEHWSTIYLAATTSRAQWRISGGFIMPTMWFKSMEKRVRVAVGYAVDVVKVKLAKENASAKADALAAEWTDKAMAMFKEALKEG